MIEFVEKHGRQMKGNFYQKRKALTREEMTEEQIEELNLYQGGEEQMNIKYYKNMQSNQ